MCSRRSDLARDLCERVRKRRRLTTRQINLLYKIAEGVQAQVGTREAVIPFDGSSLPLSVSSAFLSEEVSLDRRGDWLVDTETDTVVGRWEAPGLLRVWPNGSVLVSELESVLR